ncbi:MAG: T9SS type A sorting domain-containing protein, partial [Bacteroidota bacterium]
NGAGVVVGSNAIDTLDEGCTIQGTAIALTNMGGAIYSNSTKSLNVSGHLLSYGNGPIQLIRDESTGSAMYPVSTAIDVACNSQETQIDECAFDSFWRGMRVEDAIVRGDADNALPVDGGNNSIKATTFGLMAMNHAEINFGMNFSDTSKEALNEIIISTLGYHAAVDGTSDTYARQCWWEPYNNGSIPPLSFIGVVQWTPPLYTDPIPLTGSGGSSLTKVNAFSKSTTSPPPLDLRGQVRAALAQQNHGSTRHLIGQFLQSAASSTADFKLLRFLHRALRNAHGRGGIDSLLTICLTRTDMESKLLASDIAAEDSLYTDALGILNAYSFAGSPTLQKRVLVRKALLYPRAWRGGYQDGLLALDSLRSLNDSLLLPFIDLYPVLYSRLSHPESPAMPKRAGQDLIDRVLPSGIDVWPNYPNPFADITSFTFKLGETTHVRLAVFDAMGREVTVVADADYERGVHSAVLHSGSLPNGLYFYRLTTDAGVIQRKMMLLR